MASIFVRPVTSSMSFATKRRKDATSFWPYTSLQTQSGLAIVSFFFPVGRCGGLARSTSCACRRVSQKDRWRRSFLLLPETQRAYAGPPHPLLAKELSEVLSGRALWTMLLLVCPLVGYSFV